MKINVLEVSKKYETFAIDKQTLVIKDGSFTTLLGPSGCGKTTMLRMIAGLETPDHGAIYFDNTTISNAEKHVFTLPENRHLGFVFQDFALWPHMTVYENVAFPLRAGRKTDHLDEDINEALSLVQMEQFKNRYPESLSGGQQQRVSFARAVVAKPKCILFDEPLSALDAKLRITMRHEITDLTKKLGITSVYVTHDQAEAMSMSDWIYILDKGCVIQGDTPENIYGHPCNKFSASFIGISNWLDESSMFRPEDAFLSKADNTMTFQTQVKSIEYMGGTYQLRLQWQDMYWTVFSPIAPEKRTDVTIYVNADRIINIGEK